MRNSKTNNSGQLTTGNIPRILIKLAVPMSFGMISIILFNLVDTYFVGLLGTKELAAISFAFPVVNLIAGVTLGLGVGLTAIISQQIGAGNFENVRKITRDGLILSLIVVAVLSSAGLLTIESVFRQIGADETTLSLVSEYMTIWYFGMIFVVVPMVGNSAIRATGDTKTPALIMFAAALLNAVLDPILIFGWGFIPGLGIKGAAIASVIARIGTMAISLYILIHREKMVEMKLPSFNEMFRNWGAVLALGAPLALIHILIPISHAIVLRIIAVYGSFAVAAFGAGSRIIQISLLGAISLGASMTPFVGQNWGAGLGERVRKGILTGQGFAFLWGLFAWGVTALFAPQIASLFSEEQAVHVTIEMLLRIVLAGLAFESVFVITVSSFNGLRRPMKVAVLNVFRLFVLFIPMVYIGSKLYGLDGIFYGVTISNILAGIIGFFVIRKVGTISDLPPNYMEK
ncbi:MAG: MATE family efflux transporter [Candidatus Electryonea clarkiae]|nr:MATE family efflux transporter [Candidatus Electryonea clarkiae]MDP8286476.1 MATE family efflux transporter [Candidatus Electryonea clarkiae]